MTDRRSFLAALIGTVAGWVATPSDAPPVARSTGTELPPPGYETKSYSVPTAVMTVNGGPLLLVGGVRVTEYVDRHDRHGNRTPDYTELVCGTVTAPQAVFNAAVAALGDVCNAPTNKVSLGLLDGAGVRRWITFDACVAYAVGFSVQAEDMVVAQDLCIKAAGVPTSGEG